jgi:hypothetical protein
MLIYSHANRSYRGVAVYCGRAFAGRPASPLANRFYPKAGVPGSSLPEYRRRLWLDLAIENSPQMAELDRIISLESTNSVIYLTCFCTDESTCHCSVIKRAVAWRKGELAKGAATTTAVPADNLTRVRRRKVAA